jgi:glycosyltransferase involved in cell wall biosynthesis
MKPARAINQMRSIAIIPALNEEANIPLLLEQILSLSSDTFDVLVVDDHSSDWTVSVVEKVSAFSPRVKLITNPWAKRGLAYCYKAGFEHALKNGYDAVMGMDADGSHDPLEIPRLLRGLENADWVVGSRYVSGGDASGLGMARYLISRLANLYIEKKLRINIKDMTSGFNCFKAKLLNRVDFLNIGSKGFVFQVEMKYLALRAGFVFKEMPIRFHHRYAGRSKFSPGIVFEALDRLRNLKG